MTNLADSRNYQPTLEGLLNRNVSVLIWAGDADWICNWKGNLYTADGLKYAGHDEFKSKKLAKFTVNGKARGEYKTVKNLSYLRVFNAGHTVMAYRKQLEAKSTFANLNRARCGTAGIQADDAAKADCTLVDTNSCGNPRPVE
jgi:carboxypeptidase C (cathepsin A)